MGHGYVKPLEPVFSIHCINSCYMQAACIYNDRIPELYAMLYKHTLHLLETN
jgi:hypothetical protein